MRLSSTDSLRNTEASWEIADALAGALVHGKGCDVLIVQKHATRIRRNQSDDHVKRGRFTRAVWSQQAYDFALLHADRDAVDDLPATVYLGNIFRLEGMHVATSCPYGGCFWRARLRCRQPAAYHPSPTRSIVCPSYHRLSVCPPL